MVVSLDPLGHGLRVYRVEEKFGGVLRLGLGVSLAFQILKSFRVKLGV